ncbi:transporter substrate-binding domain-containing protein [Fusibacter sp. 3D3]|uniref:transporter substrate-binding domain-containing protein n=1 Tax=Fusibacter sp. 3D3 TaxID=1048380 RepID=UPI000852E1AA|nr:transporter substrate-binding domain-containing protein [Fusibacter sp. 3D3]
MKKKKLVIVFLASIALILFYTNQYLKIEYTINIWTFLNLNSGFTNEEKAFLDQTDVLIYGGNINEPPLGIYYEDNKQYIGLVVDYMNALSIELGTSIVSKPMVWNEALLALSKNQTDLCDMIPSEERSKLFSFSNPLYDLRGVVILPKRDAFFKTIADLDQMKVAVQKGDYAIERLKERNIKPHYVFTDDVLEALELLYSGQVSAVIGDEPVIWYHHNELINREDYKIFEEPLYSEACVIAVPNEKKALIPILNKAIYQLRRKGILSQIEDKWFGSRMTFFDNRTEKKLRLNLFVFGILIITTVTVIYLWNRSLKLLVDSKTSELSLMRDELQITFDGMAHLLVLIGEDRIIYNLNAAFSNYVGYSKSHIKQTVIDQYPLLSAIESQYKNLQADPMASFVAMNKEAKFDLKFKAYFYSVECYPLKSQHSAGESLLIMISDVTESKFQEDKLSHSNKMMAIGRLAAGVAHELRNPLGVVRNSTFILESEAQMDTPDATYAIRAINNAVKRASGIIDNLLNFSRLSSDQTDVIVLHQLIEEVVRFFSKSAFEKHVRLIIQCEHDLLINSNQEALKHILINLIQNAIDAMETKGEVKIMGCKDEKALFLRVIDEGSGLEDVIKSKIFEPFFTTKPLGQGTGLGLYIAYSEVHKLDGEITFEDNPSGGTCFNVKIPIRR